ncbi:MAG: hypothetical protein LBQ88_10270, partial [Treponema sp.]|nr:hypothetical protein [Treponema sp.]
ETSVSFTVCKPLEGKQWVRVIDTGLPPPGDICVPGTEKPLTSPYLYLTKPRSMVVLISTVVSSKESPRLGPR